ncbi:MAG: hypothetical protein EA369_08850 [Bradymonadales bacterium]|nr:MAG: hypothetical protein EA369_08850 [Bradymonadales bacterium]
MLLLIPNNNMNKSSKKPRPKGPERQGKLYEIAASQEGYFTPKQAEACGYSKYNHPYHVTKGAWVREGRGIYRLKLFPTDQVRGQLVRYSLWSRGADDKPQGVYSHETALSIYELSDLMPSKLHMTVPKKFRKWAETPKILKLYHGDLDSTDIETKRGFRVTKPLRTLLDLIEANGTSPEFIEQGLNEAIARGLIRLKELKSQKIPEDVRKKFIKWIGPNKRRALENLG